MFGKRRGIVIPGKDHVEPAVFEVAVRLLGRGRVVPCADPHRLFFVRRERVYLFEPAGISASAALSALASAAGGDAECKPERERQRANLLQFVHRILLFNLSARRRTTYS